MSESKETVEQLIVNWTIRRCQAGERIHICKGSHDEAIRERAHYQARAQTYQECIDDLARIIPLKESVSPVYEDIQKIRAETRTLCIKEIETAEGFLTPGHRYSEGLKKAVSVLIDG